MSRSEINTKLDSVLALLDNLRDEVNSVEHEEILDGDTANRIRELEKKVADLSMENSRLNMYTKNLESHIRTLVDANAEEKLYPCTANEIPDGIVFVANTEAETPILINPSPTSPRSFEKTPFILKTCSSDSCTISSIGRFILSTPSSLNVVRLCWASHKKPSRALIIKKKNNPDATHVLLDMTKWLNERNVSVFVEPQVYAELQSDLVETWNEDEKYNISNLVDFVITLGGDGTLLFASSLFPKTMPPVISFNMGTLGFLTPFSADAYELPLTRMLTGDVPLTVRSRLEYRIIRYNGDTNSNKPRSRSSTLEHFNRDDADQIRFQILNDIVIDRGTSSSMVELDCYIDTTLITTVHADGLIIATPTGSTAYSMSAGGSMVHPLTPGILMTPICPHTLSFRQMLFPDSTVLRIEVSPFSRCPASVSFDGQFKEALHIGDALIIKISKYPVPSVSPDDSNNTWFKNVREGLHWNKATSSLIENEPKK